MCGRSWIDKWVDREGEGEEVIAFNPPSGNEGWAFLCPFDG